MLRLAAFDPVDKLLQLVPIRHPVRLARQIGELASGLLPGVGLAGRRLGPGLDDAAVLGADLVHLFDVDTVPEDAVDKPLKRELAPLELLLAGREVDVREGHLLRSDGDPRGLDDGLAHEGAGGDAGAAAGEPERGLELVVALVVDAVGVRLDVAAEALLGALAKEQAQGGEVVRAHGHDGAPRQRVVEVNLVLAAGPPGDHGAGLDVLNLGGLDEGAEEGPRGVEAAVKGLEEDRRVGRVQLGQVEEDFGLGGVGHGGLLEEDVLAGADGADGPFKV